MEKIDDDSLFSYRYVKNGLYVTSGLELRENFIYELQVKIDDEVFTSNATSVENVSINSIEYLGDIRFEQEQFAEFNINFTDKPEEKNYYKFDLDYRNQQVFDDEFFAGQTFNFSMLKRKSDIFDHEVMVHSYGINIPY
jgi:hypothetical protein